MDIVKELKLSREKQQNIVKEINQLESQKLLLLQEALRLDGEIRVLVRLKETKKEA